MAAKPPPVEATPGIQGLTWQRLRRFGKWQVWHTVDAHNRALCGVEIQGQHEKSPDKWAADALPTDALAKDMCLPCSKVKVDLPRQVIPTLGKAVG